MRLVTVNDLDMVEVPGLAQTLRSTKVCSDLRVVTVTSVSMVADETKEQAQAQFKVQPTSLNDVIKALNANGYHTFDVSALLATTEDVPGEQVKMASMCKWCFPTRVGGRRLSALEMHTNICENTAFTFDHGLLIVLSSFLAAYGLLMDSSVMILAAFFVSPLMNPILVTSWGFVIRDYQLARKGMMNVVLGASFTWAIGAAIGFLMCELLVWNLFVMEQEKGMMSINSVEILSRGPPLDVAWVGTGVIASISGITAALGQSTGVTGALAGVTLAASLLPPLVNSGMCTIMGFLHPEVLTANGDSLHAVAIVSLGIYMVTVPLVMFWAFLVFRFKQIRGATLWMGSAANAELLEQLSVLKDASRISRETRLARSLPIVSATKGGMTEFSGLTGGRQVTT